MRVVPHLQEFLARAWPKGTASLFISCLAIRGKGKRKRDSLPDLLSFDREGKGKDGRGWVAGGKSANIPALSAGRRGGGREIEKHIVMPRQGFLNFTKITVISCLLRGKKEKKSPAMEPSRETNPSAAYAAIASGRERGGKKETVDKNLRLLSQKGKGKGRTRTITQTGAVLVFRARRALEEGGEGEIFSSFRVEEWKKGKGRTGRGEAKPSFRRRRTGGQRKKAASTRKGKKKGKEGGFELRAPARKG